jgi:hypothetical protein
MQVQTFRKIFARDLAKLRQEIELYSNEQNIWKVDGNITNTAGNLCLHLVGNLNTYIGKELGGTGYVRDRPLEFSDKNVPRKELLDRIDKTINMVDQSLSILTEESLQKEYPIPVYEPGDSTGYVLTSLAVHLGYHLGQINYHRRLLDKLPLKNTCW